MLQCKGIYAACVAVLPDTSNKYLSWWGPSWKIISVQPIAWEWTQLIDYMRITEHTSPFCFSSVILVSVGQLSLNAASSPTHLGCLMHAALIDAMRIDWHCFLFWLSAAGILFYLIYPTCEVVVVPNIQ